MTTLHEHPVAPVPINLAVGGMTCAGCATNIQRGLSQLPGVEDAVVNLATRRATVSPSGAVDAAQLEESMRAAITGLGYEVLTPKGHENHSIHNEHEAHLHADAARVADYLRRLVVAAVLTVPLLAISMIPAWQFSGWEWVALALATPVIFWAGWPFHRSTIKSARHGAVQMDTLVTIGTVAAWVWSTVVLVAGLDAHVYFETGAVIVTLILLGKYFEVRSTARAGDAIRALSQGQGKAADLHPGMHFDARPGEAIATDGIVVEGEAAVDTSLVTGESVPVHVAAGDEVIGGTIVVDGSLTVEATRVGAETMLAQVARMVDEALSGRARVQRLADRISSIFVPVVIGLSLVTLAGWLLATGDANGAFTAAVAVLIISCPCALGLATPLALLVATGRGAQLGILVRGPQALETAGDITTVVFDKTGTLTEGKLQVTAVSDPDSQLLIAAASVESRSEHPIARAIASNWPERLPLKGFRSTPGRGATATVQGDAGVSDVTVGARGLFDQVPDAVETWALDRESRGETVVFAGAAAAVGAGLLTGNLATRQPLAAELAIALADTVKPGAAEAVATLHGQGLEVLLLTGDNERAANAVAAQVGIDRVIAGVLPGGKQEVVEGLGADGKTRVAMVGDGVNDAPALAAAHLGLALGTGTDVAREASDVTIMRGDPRAVPTAILLSRRTLGIIRGNLFWAFAYNVAAIPLAAFGVLNPMIASAAMGASSLFVVANSLRLRTAGGQSS